MILQAILQGLALGFYLAIQPGPSFFALIQTSGKMGFKSGAGLALGIFLSDIIYVFLSYFGTAQLFNSPVHHKKISIIGGIILMIFGLVSMFSKKVRNENADVSLKAANFSLYITKGFFLNFLNPAVLLLWIAFVGKISSNAEFTPIHIFAFFSTTLCTVFSSDLLKAYYANKISQRISDKILKNINILLGLILLITGLVFIYKVL